MINETKKYSPLVELEYVMDDAEISLVYCSPRVKGRKIFGELVPYDVVWRTGANEPTTFTSDQDLTINGQTLPKGQYTFWTIPSEDEWTLIWNSGQYPWGVNYSGEASREASQDVLTVKAGSTTSTTLQEEFQIEIVEGNPSMFQIQWENTSVSVPIQTN